MSRGIVRVGPLEFEPEQEYERRKIHDALGGQIQGGISTPRKYPVILLFTSEAGREHGYGYDGWRDGGRYFEYTGEGQYASGDMAFERGNRAIRDHVENGKQLLLFERLNKRQPTGENVRFAGELKYIGHRIESRDSNDNPRDVIVFVLAPVR